ncbi:MAG: oxidoreductase [Bacteroidales bacterium]|nr:oxidoreductase [Bacteroidales bacterium]
MSKEKWNRENIPDLAGKVIIVTGGNSGLGYESVKAFAANGARVILASRSEEKGREASEKIIKDFPDADIRIMKLDLADLSSVESFAASFRAGYDRLDILMNNAGIMTTPYFRTRDGFEGQMGTNHFGHFALTGRLMDIIMSSAGSRIVNVSSSAHRAGKMDFDNLLFEDGRAYSPMKAYGRSKLANLLFTYELQRRLESAGSDTASLAAHPGLSATNLMRYIDKKVLYKLFSPLVSLVAQSAAMGALPQIRAAVDPDARGGEYYGPGGFGGMKGYPVRVKSNSASHNMDDARKLWELSEELTGVKW